MKKNVIRLLITVSTIFVLAACGDEDNVTEPPENAPAEHENNNNETSENDNNQTTTYSFTSFDLDVDYKGNESVEVDYENEVEGMEAKYEDNRKDTMLRGNEAMNKLTPIFEAFTFDQSTADEEVIQAVKDAFSIEEGYQEFELEVEYADGTTKEYRES
ncbi:YusW family protein [Pontibacillus litoralis]|uniref:YusW-like protein n=1 Tax=Pontibacillus litoralis JSM 072002 TaxID=1385512 RepID=A0A0A5HMX1_9BACI|nr:YusW family protein [Pontibacillus litoralis]KGX84957.1 hypothetical protein N784_11320 [Pontibacillus litoralis JSM 072002]